MRLDQRTLGGQPSGKDGVEHQGMRAPGHVQGKDAEAGPGREPREEAQDLGHVVVPHAHSKFAGSEQLVRNRDGICSAHIELYGSCRNGTVARSAHSKQKEHKKVNQKYFQRGFRTRLAKTPGYYEGEGKHSGQDYGADGHEDAQKRRERDEQKVDLFKGNSSSKYLTKITAYGQADQNG